MKHEVMLNIRGKLKEHPASHDRKGVYLNIPLIWKMSQEYNHSYLYDPTPCEEFLDDLIYYDLIETICATNLNEGNEEPCKPVCACAKIALLMEYPDNWDKIREPK